jgi:glutathione S-transferase
MIVHRVEPKAHRALGVMEQRLAASDWIAAAACTLADYALYPYTRAMEESGFDPGEFPAICRWFERMEAQPKFIAMSQDRAAESLMFREHLVENRRP